MSFGRFGWGLWGRCRVWRLQRGASVARIATTLRIATLSATRLSCSRLLRFEHLFVLRPSVLKPNFDLCNESIRKLQRCRFNLVLIWKMAFLPAQFRRSLRRGIDSGLFFHPTIKKFYISYSENCEKLCSCRPKLCDIKIEFAIEQE